MNRSRNVRMSIMNRSCNVRMSDAGVHSALYRGELAHARRDDLTTRAFRYGVYTAVLDLDELPALDRTLRLFSHGRRNLFSFDERDYAATLSPAHAPGGGANAAAPDELRGATPGTDELRAGLAALRAANGLPAPATTRLVTNLRVLGYTFNPVSFFLDYDARGELTSVIAEVNNTYGGRFRYVLGPDQRIESRGEDAGGTTRGDVRGDDARRGSRRVGFRHVRELFVSPFLHGPATYDFYFDAPLDGPALTIAMHVHQRDRRTFVARLTGARAPLSDRTLLAAALRYPLMSAQVIGLIHYEAIKMRLAGVPYRRPDRDHRPLVDGR